MTEGGIVKICDAYTSARMALDHSQIVVEALHGVIKNAKEDEIDDSLVHVPGAKFPLAWNAEYYAVRQVSDKERVTCKTCEGTGKVRLPSPTGDVYREYDWVKTNSTYNILYFFRKNKIFFLFFSNFFTWLFVVFM